MALQKNRQYNNTEVSYWKISGINITYTGKMAQVYVIGFADEEQRQEGIDNKIAFENYICKGEDFNKYFNVNVLSTEEVNPLISAYNYLKNKVDIFINSVDI
ncbi:hypothetical protein [Clostridium sp.]|uniref:hypothetical protein n=1 Tax=Clostridium sp. TaxID=1506 RepID=UPI00290BF418|nr:hypothetical protein [Clostridium sp.]MDU3524248.1 hypothetical protein [Clostridium sp.]MDU3546277.1 hypothetical protein [Clostridium sp.]MDU6363286.1 hypothetical protein [Clostridium sp.]